MPDPTPEEIVELAALEAVAKLESEAKRLKAKGCINGFLNLDSILAACALAREAEGYARRFRAPIVCMCGSTRFKQAWIAENARLTGEGQIVLSVGFWGHHERIAPSDEQKQALDDLHKRKIDLCDWVWVIDVGGYVGESTRSEIAYAETLGRPVRYLSQEFPDYTEPVDLVAREAEGLRERVAHYAREELGRRLDYQRWYADATPQQAVAAASEWTQPGSEIAQIVEEAGGFPTWSDVPGLRWVWPDAEAGEESEGK